MVNAEVQVKIEDATTENPKENSLEKRYLFLLFILFLEQR